MKIKKITFIRPNIGDYRSRDAMTPLSIAILSSLTPKDVDIEFFDERIEQLPESIDADIIAFTIETFTANHSYKLAKKYKKSNNLIVAGGYHVTFLPDECLEFFDVVFVGDAEGLWENFINDVLHNNWKHTYNNVNNLPPLLTPTIDRSIFNNKNYSPLFLTQYNRGCRFFCDFCSIHSFYNKTLRTQKIDFIIDDLITNNNKNNIVFFVDDNIYGQKVEFDILLEALKQTKTKWCCQISLDIARDELLLSKMAESGCFLVLIGFETLNKNNLKQMKKNWNSSFGNYSDNIKKIKNFGINIYGTFVFGYDNDTVDSFDETLNFAIENKLSIANFNPLTPTPKTPLYDRLLAEKRLLNEKWWLDDKYKYGESIFIPKNFSPDFLSEKCYELKNKFYSLHSIIDRVILNSLIFKDFKTYNILLLANIVSKQEIRNKQFRNLK